MYKSSGWRHSAFISSKLNLPHTESLMTWINLTHCVSFTSIGLTEFFSLLKLCVFPVTQGSNFAKIQPKDYWVWCLMKMSTFLIKRCRPTVRVENFIQIEVTLRQSFICDYYGPKCFSKARFFLEFQIYYFPQYFCFMMRWSKSWT